MIMFLIKGSSALHRLLVLLLVLGCLSSAFGAKITKKMEKPTQNNNEEDNKAQAAEAAAAAAAAQAGDEDDDNEEANEDNEEEATDDDDDDDDDEDEQEKEEVVAVKKKKNKDATATSSSSSSIKNALRPAEPTDLSVWGMVRTLWGWLRSDLSESLFGDDDDKQTSAVEGRTFGKIRRLQMALIPIIFKFGVLSAMVAFLVAIGMKSLFLLKVLVVMNALAILGKFITLKSSLFGQFEHTAPAFNYPGWNPHAKESWGTTGPAPSHPHPPSKEIHLHIHGNAQTQLGGSQGYGYDSQGQGWASRSDPYSGYAPTGNTQYVEGQSDVPNKTDSILALLPTKYTARNLIR